MDNIIKTILFIIGGVTVIFLLILLLPVILLVYLFLPKKKSHTWMRTFAQHAKNGQGRRKKTARNDFSTSEFSNNIPASEDIIDVTAQELNDKSK